MAGFAYFFAAVLCLASSTPAAADPLDVPARGSALAERRLITSIAHAGNRALVAVGQRGHVLRSEDGGRTWLQGKVPVSSDLTAVQFVDARVGYATGHDGVVLRSDDGGASWTRVLDGRTANQLLLEAMQHLVAAGGGEPAKKLLDEARRNVELGPDKPFLDLWFANANEGFVVGAYNLIFHTADGGKSWQPWFDRTDNPKLLSLYAIRPAGNTLYIAGESGLLLKLDAAAQRFRALSGDYKGSYFGLLATRAGVLAFGMRGNAFLSRDEGQTWQAVTTGLTASITAADAGDGRIALVDQSGSVAASRDGGSSFSRVVVQPPMPLAAIALTEGGAVLGGPRGLRSVDIAKDK
jgi:photosystem II stability/assembly factor-like uncharacterized protein